MIWRAASRLLRAYPSVPSELDGSRAEEALGVQTIARVVPILHVAIREHVLKIKIVVHVLRGALFCVYKDGFRISPLLLSSPAENSHPHFLQGRDALSKDFIICSRVSAELLKNGAVNVGENIPVHPVDGRHHRLDAVAQSRNLQQHDRQDFVREAIGVERSRERRRLNLDIALAHVLLLEKPIVQSGTGRMPLPEELKQGAVEAAEKGALLLEGAENE
eukprot:scaffold71_cov247-Pinguiococcus_pyrenoidosus.AAC.26